MAFSLKYSPKEKLPSISKKVWWRLVKPTFSRSLCLPPARTHFCAEVALSYSRFSRPRKTSLNWFMPALVKSRVGSPCGTSEELRTRRWPLPSKKRRKVSRISLPLQNFGCACVLLTLSSVVFDYGRRRKRAPMWRDWSGRGQTPRGDGKYAQLVETSGDRGAAWRIRWRVQKRPDGYRCTPHPGVLRKEAASD